MKSPNTSKAMVALALYSAGVLTLIAYNGPNLFHVHRVAPPLISPPNQVFDTTPVWDPEMDQPQASEPSSVYRGDPARTGVTKKGSIRLPLKSAWYAEPINVGIHTASKSSPAVDETGSYVGSDDSWFYGFDPNGKPRWKFFIDGAVRGIHGTAALDDRFVYIGGYNGKLYCLRKSDGRFVWSIRVGSAVGSSPLPVGNAIYVSAEIAGRMDGYAIKLDRRTGKRIWQSEWFGEQVHSSPTLDMDHGLVFVGANNGKLHALDSETGRTRWVFEAAGAIKGTPLYLKGIVYFTSWSMRLFAVDAQTGQLKWNTELGAISQSSPTFDPGSGNLIVGSAGKSGGTIFGIRLEDGKVLWRHPSSAKVQSSGTAVKLAGGAGAWGTVITCGTDTLCVFDGKTGQVLQSIRIPGLLTGVPAVHGDSVYIALDEGGLARFDSTTGTNQLDER